MKSFGVILLLPAVLWLVGVGCKKDHCKTVNCYNGGTCQEGTCLCLDGYEGFNCARESRAKYLGTYSGVVVIPGPDFPVNVTISPGPDGPLSLSFEEQYAELVWTGTLKGDSVIVPSQYYLYKHINGSGQFTKDTLAMYITIQYSGQLFGRQYKLVKD